MNPLEILWEFVSSKLGDTEWWPLTVAIVVTAFIAFELIFKLKKWQYRVEVVMIAVGLIVTEGNFLLKLGCIFLYILAAILALLASLCFCIPFLWNQHRLRKILKLCQQQSCMEALKLLNTINTGWLTTKQLQAYQKKRFFVLVNLGSLRKAKVYLEEICPKKGAFYHFSLHFLAFRSGDLKTSFCEIQKAEDSDDFRDDPFLQCQMIMNHGACYAAEHNFHLADEYYRKAVTFYDEQKLQDEDFLVTLYYNFAFNCLRLSPGTAEWETALDECQAKLNMEKIDAQIRMLNFRLELLRQIEAPREIMNKLSQEAFATIIGRKLPLKNKVLFAASAARVAWAAQINPLPSLKFLSDNLSVIESLPANQRYQVYNELDILFQDLYGPANNSLTKLRERTSAYRNFKAESDLRLWQNGLPEEAVYERCDCLKKIAVLHRSQAPYDRNSVVSFQQNAIRFYHDNGLYLDELCTRQDVMDELLDTRNRDKDYRPICIDEIREQLSSAENLLSQLEGHPALVESYIRLGCYCQELDEYERSLHYVRLFWGTDISVQNFAPWLRRYYAILLLRSRVIMFDKAIKEAATDKRLRSFSEDIQDWFATYPRHHGGIETLLLERFISVPVKKTKVWLPNGEEELQGHTWLYVPQLDLNIDLTYPQFTDDQLNRCIFFYNGRHPFEAGTSLTLQLSQKNSHVIFADLFPLQIEYKPDSKTKEMVDTLYNIICGHVPHDCPAIEGFSRLFQEFVGPIPIQE